MSEFILTPSIPSEVLSDREREVMLWTARGKTRGEISCILDISEETVKDYLKKACRKLNAVNKTQAVSIAITSGLIAPFQDISKSNHI